MALQEFGFKDSQYERPGQRWNCGNPDGQTCAAGPDKQGRCRGSAVCRPYFDEELSRWRCTRPEQLGGPCPTGPAADGSCCTRVGPCVPVESLRSRRARTSMWVAGISFGLLLLVSTTLWLRGTFLDPGNLTSKHAAVAECGDCHAAMEVPEDNWFSLFYTPHSIEDDNHRCGTCHLVSREEMAGADETSMGNPHGLGMDQLAFITERIRSKALGDGDGVQPVAMSSPGPFNLFAKLGDQMGMEDDMTRACSACHVEHRGTGAELTAVAKDDCESCHVLSHPDFASQHPPFTDVEGRPNYPYKQRTRIYFDHTDHFESQFTKAKYADVAPKGCASCHSPDLVGERMTTVSFEDGCMACHQKNVGRDEPELVLAIPEIDVAYLAENDIAIGSWPQVGEDPENGDLLTTPVLASLIAVVAPDREEDLQLILEDEIDLATLGEEEVDEEILEAVGNLAWTIKEMLAGGRGACPEHEAPEGAAARAAVLLSTELPAFARAQLFPDLCGELEARAGGEAPESTVHVIGEGNPKRTLGGWSREGTGFRYLSSGHRDPQLTAGIEAWYAALGEDPLDYVVEDLVEGVEVLEAVGAGGGPADCVKCHSVDIADFGTVVNWKAMGMRGSGAGFSRFNHTAHFQSRHFSALDNATCKTCHALDEESGYAESFEDNFDPHEYASNFNMMDRQLCGDCHTPQRAGDDCTVCHNYHVGDFQPTLPEVIRESRAAAVAEGDG